MPRKKLNVIDRGPDFWMYVLSDTNRPFCQNWLNSFPCGTAVVDGKTVGLYFIHFLKYGDGDSKGECAEIFDVGPLHADGFIKKQSVKKMLEEAEVFDSDMLDILSTPKAIVKADKGKGKSGEQIINERSAILTNEFAGFTFDDVLRERPDLWQPAVDSETGVETPNIWKCNLGPTVES